MRVDGLGSLFHHGSYYYSLTHDRCGHIATVAAPRRELEQTVKTHYASCQQCARPFHWVCPGFALLLSPDTITAEEDLATGRIVVRCSSCGADAWG